MKNDEWGRILHIVENAMRKLNGDQITLEHNQVPIAAEPGIIE